MHQMILHVININDEEISFGIGKKVLNFGLEEFAIVTGLNCESFPFSQSFAIPEDVSFKEKFFPNFENIDTGTIAYVYDTVKDVSNEDLMKLANLYFLEEVLLSKDSIRPIDKEHLDVVNHLDEFYLYPWGRVVFKETVKALRSVLKSMAKGVAKGYHRVCLRDIATIA